MSQPVDLQNIQRVEEIHKAFYEKASRIITQWNADGALGELLNASDAMCALHDLVQSVAKKLEAFQQNAQTDEDDDNTPELYDVDLETDTADTLRAIEQGDEAIRKAILWAFIRKSELPQLLQKPKDANGDIVFELPDGAYLLLQQAEDESLWWCTLFAVTEDAVHLDGYSDKGEAGVGKTIQEAFDDFMLCFKRLCKDLPARYGWSSLMMLDQKVEGG